MIGLNGLHRGGLCESLVGLGVQGIGLTHRGEEGEKRNEKGREEGLSDFKWGFS